MEILVAAVVIVILLVLGIGVFIASRREATGLPTDLLEPPGAPPRSGTPTAPPVEEPVVEGPVVVEEPPTFMARLGRARSTLAGYLGSIMSRGVDETTFDELEEALIRADAGAAVASELVAELREVAKANRIDEPAALVGELAALMKSRLDADR